MVLLERRPPKGLLGGTLAFPSTGWDGSDQPPPVEGADWVSLGPVAHVFTHFSLDLDVRLGRTTPVGAGRMGGAERFQPRRSAGLMRKVWTRVAPEIG